MGSFLSPVRIVLTQRNESSDLIRTHFAHLALVVANVLFGMNFSFFVRHPALHGVRDPFFRKSPFFGGLFHPADVSL